MGPKPWDAPAWGPEPARYFPLERGRYRLKVGLRRLGTDFDNGAADGQLLQVDRLWPDYRQAKLTARRERLGKYVAADPSLTPAVQRAAAAVLLERMTVEHPGRFRRVDSGPPALHCTPSGETLRFDEKLRLIGWADPGPDPGYTSTLDALACQLQEDLALIQHGEDGDRLVYLHLCFPNHWAAEDKLGADFAAVHGPVPGAGRINRQAAQLTTTAIKDGPFVRFAWGVATDPRLNHHPEPPPDTPDPSAWQGRRFDPLHPRLFLRVERQVLWGLPEVSSYLFTIRTYIYPAGVLSAARRRMLADAIESMDAPTRHYKGIGTQAAGMVEWLRR